MRITLMLLALLALTSCASRQEKPDYNGGRTPQAIEDGSFPGRSN